MSNSNLFLTISLDPSSALTSYQQIIEQFKSLISSGSLGTGEKVPSTRELAKSLGTSRTTTIKAYDILISEGFFVAKPKQGVFVAERLPTLQLVGRSEVEALEQTKSPINNLEQSEHIELSAGADVSAFPHKEWAASMRRSWLKPDEKLMKGLYRSGLPELKSQLVDYLKSLRGLECDADQIIITSGNRDALSILSHALIDQKKNGQHGVWLENPCFTGISAFFSWLDVNLNSLRIDEEGAVLPDLTSLNQQSKGGDQIALITPNRQYPLGRVMSSSRRQEWLSLLANLAEKKGSQSKLWLVEDDYDNEFLYQGRVGVPLMNMDATESTFFVGSFSKVLFRGIRLGFIVAPKSKVEDLLVSQSKLGASASLPMQAVVADFIGSGDFSSHLRRMRRHYLEKRNYVSTLLNKQISLYFTHSKPSGGMHTLIYFKPHWIKRHEAMMLTKYKGKDIAAELDVHIEHCMKKRNISIAPLSSHFFVTDQAEASDIKPELQQGFVLGFTQNSKQTSNMALEILLQQIKNHFL